MFKYSGQISKLRTKLGSPIQYALPVGKELIPLNDLIGRNICFQFNNEIRCIECDLKIKKTFMQGYCYPCFINSPRTSECILKPELCRAHEGEARDMNWAKKYCLQDQYVYISLTSNLKVGVTRHTQIPTRWIDQGAHKALILAKTPNRYTAGVIEKALSQHISDRTYWRRMLLGEYPDLDLYEQKNTLIKLLDENFKSFVTKDDKLIELHYPAMHKPKKIKSLNLDKTPIFKGKLMGIKGQYLFLDNEFVLNIRKYTGYKLNVFLEENIFSM